MARVPNAADYGLWLIESGMNPRKRAGGIRNAQLSNMRANGFINMIWDEFNSDTLNTFNWTVDGDTGTTALAVPAAASAQAGGVLTGTTATDDNEAISIYGHPIWSGDLNCGMLVTAKFDDVENFFFETGFTDPLTDYTLPAINDIDTPTITNGGSTVATLTMDTDQTLVTATFITDGDATYATAATAPSTAWSPTADTYFTAIIQLIGNTAVCAVLDANYNKVFQVSKIGVEGGTLVQPWFIVGNRAASEATVPTLRRLAVWGDKN